MGISIWQLLIILAIVLLLFGAKRLRTLGSDLGSSVRGFREAMKEGEQEGGQEGEETVDPEKKIEQAESRVIDGEVEVAEVSKEHNKT